MKQCPRCLATYDDDQLNFCLNDGEMLTAFGRSPTQSDDEATRTLILDQSRVTNPAGWLASPLNAPLELPPHQRLQNFQDLPLGSPQYARSADQTIPTAAMILGIASLVMICCYGGLWLGLPAAILGFIGIKNADKDGDRYGGRGMAVAGLVLGIVTLIFSIVHILFIIFAVMAG